MIRYKLTLGYNGYCQKIEIPNADCGKLIGKWHEIAFTTKRGLVKIKEGNEVSQIFFDELGHIINKYGKKVMHKAIFGFDKNINTTLCPWSDHILCRA